MTKESIETDIVLIGAGIMSATLATFFKKLEPNFKAHIFERLEEAAVESSSAWNNAGTGHAALCELNYTPELADGTIETKKALNIMEQYEVSKQFWAHLVKKNELGNPKDFIRSVPHMSFVRGEKDINYLNKRHQALSKYELFKDMKYSEDTQVIEKWIPLVTENRPASDKIAATYSSLGTDVDFGNLTKVLLNNLGENYTLHLGYEAKNIKKTADGKWSIKVKNLKNGATATYIAKFVFIGAGGGSLKLLQKSGIPESKKFGGFPVGGSWLVCNNPEIGNIHNAKVYGQASVGAPPMSVPHLDTRVIDGKKAILFGPFASFSTKFLKEGSLMDLFDTIKLSNLLPMMKVGITNLDLEKYLIQQLRLSLEDRMNELRLFYPNAKSSDWALKPAGQRVQIIYNDPQKGGTLQFGTELVTGEGGTIAALLGASPGASTSVSVMLRLLEQCFPEQMKSGWKTKIKEMIPSFGEKLEGNPELIASTRAWTSEALQLDK